MDILKLLIVFLIIIAVLWLKRPISIAVTAAGIAAIFLYGLGADQAMGAILKGATAWTTIETLLVFYSITFLQRMMEKRGNLKDTHKALNGLFNNNRINASVAPFFLGMLPAAGTVLICGPIVRESVGDSLKKEETAAITSYFRHISESFLPTYTTIFIALTFANGRVTAPAFILAMLPMIFKEILTATGVIQSLPEFFSTLPIPAFLVFALIFFLGTIVAGSQAMIVLCMSMAMGSVAPGHTGLAMFVLMMCMNYIAMQLSPTHICLTICAEDFSVSLGDLVKKTVPLVLVFTVISFLYYGILYMAGF